MLHPRLLVHVVKKSNDSKTGPIPVTYQSEESTCPDSCPLRNGPCYARFYRVGRVWKKLNEATEAVGNYLTWNRFIEWVERMPVLQAWRYGVAGDLPHIGDGKTIDAPKLRQLTKANARGNKRGWLYTHHDPMIAENAAAIKEANDGKLTVNVSADSLGEADRLYDLGIAPVVTLMPRTENGECLTPKGRRVIECPASNPNAKTKNCVGCKFLCQRRDRDFIIGFPPHGTGEKAATKIMQEAA